MPTAIENVFICYDFWHLRNRKISKHPEVSFCKINLLKLEGDFCKVDNLTDENRKRVSLKIIFLVTFKTWHFFKTFIVEKAISAQDFLLKVFRRLSSNQNNAFCSNCFFALAAVGI